MKAKRLLLNSALGLAVCCSLASAIAQDTSDTPVAKPAQIRGSSPPAPASGKIARLNIPKGSLSDAVQAVEQHLPKGEEPMNVIFAGDAESQPVPALTLRNVDGLDALMLIAAAANVQVEPIRSVADSRYIGFRFSQRQRPSIQQGMMHGDDFGNTVAAGGGMHPMAPPPGVPGRSAGIVATGTASGGAGAAGSSGGPTARSSGFGSRAPGTTGSGAAAPVGSSGVAFQPPSTSAYGMAGRAGPGGVDAATSGRLPSVRTHVYPLAEITPFVKLTEIEETLHGLLKTSGASADDAKLAFHEKTGVLVARAPGEVQELIGQLLNALAQNNAENRETDATREWAQMQVKLDSLTRQLARTEEEVLRIERRAEQAEALARQYANELSQRKESQSNP